jgi:hypothetical protein
MKRQSEFEDALLVELVDLWAEELLGLVALDLHRVGQDAPAQEGLSVQEDVLGLLEALQSRLLPDLRQVVHELHPHLLARAQLLVGALHVVLGRELLHELPVRDCDGDHEGLGGVAVDVYFLQLVALEVGVLNLLRRHVLALLQLEDVLLAVDHAQAARLGAQRPHVASQQPAVLVDRLLRLLLVVVVPHKHPGASRPNLPPGRWVALTVPVSRQVVHLGDVHQLELEVALHNSKATVGPPTCLTTGS